MAEGSDTGSGKRRRRVSDALAYLVLLAGLVLLARPVVTDWWFALNAERTISQIQDVYDDMDDPARLENLAQAEAWNARLCRLPYEEPAGGVWEYRRQLTYRSPPDSMMAWVDIPRISTRLPIYHGTGEAELMAGVGHCDWSALPVGGEGTRCVLTAHSGMQGTRMFDDVRELDEGDVFVLWSLGEPKAYEVVDMRVLLPDDAVEYLRDPEPGRDLCSLVTCTPYGVNSHRLVVTGERCPYTGGYTPGPGAFVNRRTLPLLAGMAVLLLVGIAYRRRRGRGRLDGHNPYAPAH